MDGGVKGVLAVIAILVVFGGGPILIYRLYNQNRYGKRNEAVSGFARARGYELLGGTVNELKKLEKIAPGYDAGLVVTSNRRDETLREDLPVYRIVEEYMKLAVPVGDKIWIHNLVVIPRDAGVQHLFDYVYRIPSGSESFRTKEYVHTMTGFTSDRLTLPWFGLVPAATLARTGSDSGYSFDTHPRFAGKYGLFGEDEEAIRRIFNPEVLTFLENHEGLRVHGNGTVFVMFREESRYLDPGEMDSLVEDANTLFSLIVGK